MENWRTFILQRHKQTLHWNSGRQHYQSWVNKIYATSDIWCRVYW